MSSLSERSPILRALRGLKKRRTLLPHQTGALLAGWLGFFVGLIVVGFVWRQLCPG